MRNTVTAFGLSFVVVNVLSAVLVVVKERNTLIHDWMAALTGHHWITHAVLVIAAYLVLGVALSYLREWRIAGCSLSFAVVASTLVSGLIVAGFFAFA